MEHAQRALVAQSATMIQKISLNPYFNGTCSKSYGYSIVMPLEGEEVLILILMEHAQRADSKDIPSMSYVLILILMEHAQRAIIVLGNLMALPCLNPYFNGTCSKRVHVLQLFQ